MPKPRNKPVNKIDFTEASQNIFEDLGFDKEQAANLLMRSKLIIQINDEIKQQGWTQSEAAKRLGVVQPRISELRTAQIDKFSVDTLVLYLEKLGRTVDITDKVSTKSAELERKLRDLAEKGMELIIQKRGAKSVPFFQDALKLARQLGDKEEVADCCHLLGGALAIANKKPEAIAYFKEASEIYRNLPDRRKYHMCVKVLGMAHAEFRKLPIALGYLKEAVMVADELRGAVDIEDDLIWLGAVQDSSNDYAGSEQSARRIFALQVSRFGSNSRKLIPIYEVLEYLCKKQKKLSEAKRYQLEIIRLRERPDWISSFFFDSYPTQVRSNLHDNRYTLPAAKFMPLLMHSAEHQ